MANVVEIADHAILSECEESEANDPVVDADHSMSYNEFFVKHLQDNRPCIIKSNVTDAWPCRREWELNGAPNFESLRKVFGNSTAPIANCGRKYYNSQMKNDMTLSDYLDYWMKYRNSDYSESLPLLYLKDWHCVKNFPNVPIYEVPQYFASDWLNEYYTSHAELDDDYMFVYMGPKGTWTPFHADVFTSYSWSANIVGKKRWLLFPPGEEDSLRDAHGQLVYDATSEDLCDQSVYPKYKRENVKCYDVIQEPGQIMFVPSGWHHQVWNLEDTISINHNWINGCNIWNVWLILKAELLAVMKEVDDWEVELEDWAGHCQLMLKASLGMDYIQFFNFLSFVAQRRLQLMIEDEPVISFNKWHLGKNHCLYDLRQVAVVLEDFIKDAKEKCIYSQIYRNNEAENLLDRINRVL